MSSIFLSSSVPVRGRGQFFETAEPFLIQNAVREFVTLVLAGDAYRVGWAPSDYAYGMGSM